MAYILCFVALFALSLVNGLFGEATEKGYPTLYQADNGFMCQKCEKGQYLQKACDTDHGPSTCQTCPTDRFMDKKNNYTMCAECSTCHGGQETIAECSSVSNTVCRCPLRSYRVGILGRCYRHSVCKDGSAIVAPGTPWTDTVCSNKSTEIIISTNVDQDQTMEDPDQNLRAITTVPTQDSSENPPDITTVPTQYSAENPPDITTVKIKYSAENPPPDIVRVRVLYVLVMVLSPIVVILSIALFNWCEKWVKEKNDALFTKYTVIENRRICKSDII